MQVWNRIKQSVNGIVGAVVVRPLLPLALGAVVLGGCDLSSTLRELESFLPGSNQKKQAHLLLGNPSGNNQQLENHLVLREAFALSYNAANKGPNWVAWHLEQGDIGEAPRGQFVADPLLPAAWQVSSGDYSGGGYDRGHVCPSGDRTRDVDFNQQTFVMSNMLPQAAALNQKVWNKLEAYCRYLVREQKQELYIVSGGSGSAGKLGKQKINIPNTYWKIIVALPHGENDLARIDKNTRVIAVSIPNRNREEIAASYWTDWITNVDQLEKTTGYDFLSALPDDVEKALSAKRDAGIEQDKAKHDTIPDHPAPAMPGQVWVNTRSGVFHRPGMRYYGKTKEGQYMTEVQAMAKGYRAAPN